jgi:sec-independent protein translocase protein TatC
VVTIEQSKKFRGCFVAASFTIAAVVTPPDVISQLALAVPMCILYEPGIIAAQIFIKTKQAPEAAAAPAAGA